MTPPRPAGFTADENEPGAPSRWLALYATIRRALAIVGAVVIAAAVAGLAGYAVGRHSVAPRPGEEARIDSAVAVLTRQRDSLRNVAAWEEATRKILEQKQAALPRVEIREPGVIVIRPVGIDAAIGPALEPRIVVVPVEVTQALSLERQINASLRAELDATRALAATETARADSLARSVVLARASRRGWLDGRVVVYAGRSVSGRWDAGVGVALWRWP